MKRTVSKRTSAVMLEATPTLTASDILDLTAISAPPPARVKRRKVTDVLISASVDSEDLSTHLMRHSSTLSLTDSKKSESTDSSEEWTYENACRLLCPPEVPLESEDTTLDELSQSSAPQQSLSAAPADGISSLAVDLAVDVNAQRQSLCAITSDLYVARSLRDLSMPTIAWTESRWNKWRSHEFSYSIRIQRQPLSQQQFGPVNIAQRIQAYGVEELFLTLPTATLVSMHNDRLQGIAPRSYLTDLQIDVAIEFLTEAFFSEDGDEPRRVHFLRWGNMRPRALVLSQEGLEREAMAVTVAFLATEGHESAREIYADIISRSNVSLDWKGLLSPLDIARMEMLAAGWRADRLGQLNANLSSSCSLEGVLLSTRAESPRPAIISPFAAPTVSPYTILKDQKD